MRERVEYKFWVHDQVVTKSIEDEDEDMDVRAAIEDGEESKFIYLCSDKNELWVNLDHCKIIQRLVKDEYEPLPPMGEFINQE